MDRNLISSGKCPKMAAQFNDVATVKKKAAAVAVGGMWRWPADSAAGRIATTRMAFNTSSAIFKEMSSSRELCENRIP